MPIQLIYICLCIVYVVISIEEGDKMCIFAKGWFIPEAATSLKYDGQFLSVLFANFF